MRKFHMIWTVAIVAIALSGCSGAMKSVIPGSPASPVNSMGKQTVTFKIDVPAKTNAVRTRTPKFVSPATTQLAIDIQQGGTSITGYPQTVSLTPTSSGCTSTLANTFCQLSVSLAPGSYTATLTTKDAGGNALSAAQSIAVTVTAGTNNTIPLTLSGIPHSLLIASGSTLVHGSQNEGFTLYGRAAQTFIVTAQDADGNTIIGPGSPTYSISTVTGTGTWTASTASSTAPNSIAITPPGAYGDSATLQVTATYSDSTCSTSGAVCTMSFPIKNNIQRLYVLNYSGDSVSWSDLPLGTGSTGTISLPSGSPQYRPQGMAIGPNGNVYVIDCNQGCNSGTSIADEITVYDRNGNLLQTIADPGTKTYFNYPKAIWVDANDNLYVGSAGYVSQSSFTTGNNFVAVFAPHGSQPAQTISLGASGNTEVSSLQTDVSGNLFIGTSGATKEYTSPVTAPTLAASFGGSAQSMVVDPTDILIQGSGGNGTFGWVPSAYTSQYSVTPRTIGCCTFYAITNAVALDSNDNLYMAQCGSQCGSYTHQGIDYFSKSLWQSCLSSSSCFTPPSSPTTYLSSGDFLSALAIDASGNLYVSDRTANTISSYTTPITSSSTPANTLTSGINFPTAMAISQ